MPPSPALPPWHPVSDVVLQSHDPVTPTSQSCTSLCAGVGKECDDDAQATLKEAYRILGLMLVAGHVCTSFTIVPDVNAEAYGVPYVHSNLGDCFYSQNATASCAAAPVDSAHRRLCTCGAPFPSPALPPPPASPSPPLPPPASPPPPVGAYCLEGRWPIFLTEDELWAALAQANLGGVVSVISGSVYWSTTPVTMYHFADYPGATNTGDPCPTHALLLPPAPPPPPPVPWPPPPPPPASPPPDRSSGSLDGTITAAVVAGGVGLCLCLCCCAAAWIYLAFFRSRRAGETPPYGSLEK